MESFALAILVRIAETGDKSGVARHPELPPCSFTTKTLLPVSMLWSYYRKRIREDNIKDYKSLLLAIKETEQIDMKAWCAANKSIVDKATADLLEFVESEKNPGFRVYG